MAKRSKPTGPSTSAQLAIKLQLLATPNTLSDSTDASEYEHGPRWKRLLVS
jgi:hypothetical protein